MTDMMIRRATKDDASAIADIHVTTWQAAYRDQLPDELLDSLSVAGREMQFDQRLENPEPRSKVFVAEDDGEIVGFADCCACRDEDLQEYDVGEIRALYVRPDRWREGVGSELLRRCVEFLEDAGYDFIALWVLDDNDQARDFYEKAGFIPDGSEETRDYKGYDLPTIRYRAMLP